MYFAAMNKTLTIAYANERSMVSAQLSANEPNPDIVKCIKFFAHGMWVTPLLDNSHIERLGEIYEYDNVVDFRYANRANLVQLVKQMYFAAMNSPYPCDGIVIQHSNTSDNDGHCNFDRIAIKQFDESLYSAETEVSGFSWTLKNNGSLYPNVQLKPVQINGSTVDNPAGYSLDYLNRMGLSVGAKVVVTLRGGVIPYITKVLAPGNGDLCFPPNIIEPEPGDMHLWSKDSEDAIQRLRFIRGCQMLDLKDCGTESFSKLYDAGYKTIFDLKFVSFAKLVSTGIFAKTATTENLADRIRERIDTFNYVWLILSLRIPGIGFKAANILGQKLSGYNLTNCGITEAMSNVLSDEVLIDKIKVTAKPVLIEHADLSEEFKAIQIAKNSTFGAFRKKAILSKKPSNGMKKAEFAAKYLSDYDITDDLAQADILVYPEGETSNKINWMLSHGKEARTYESFIN
jgi:NAD-dependent DNA ligase